MCALEVNDASHSLAQTFVWLEVSLGVNQIPCAAHIHTFEGSLSYHSVRSVTPLHCRVGLGVVNIGMRGGVDVRGVGKSTTMAKEATNGMAKPKRWYDDDPSAMVAVSDRAASEELGPHLKEGGYRRARTHDRAGALRSNQKYPASP